MQEQSEKRDLVSHQTSRAMLKKKYTSPRLSDYGSVRKLTHGNGSSPNPDGHSGMSMKSLNERRR
jgi:hypothetical protein